MFDGPHPFEVWSERRRPTIFVDVNARQGQLPVPSWTSSGIVDSLSYTTIEKLAALTANEWRAALADVESALFDDTAFGQARLDARFLSVWATIAVQVPGSAQFADCRRRLECFEGVWVDSGERRCDVRSDGETPHEHRIRVEHSQWNAMRDEDRENTAAARAKFWVDVDRAFTEAVGYARQLIDQKNLLDRFRTRCIGGGAGTGTGSG